MRYRSYPPPPALAPWIECFWSLEGEAADASPRPLLVVPDGRPELIVHYQQPFLRRRGDVVEREGRAFLFGQLLSAIDLVPDGPVGVVAARLRPEGARLFHCPPAHEMAGQAVPIEDAWPEAKDLPERVGNAATFWARRRVLEESLLQKVATAPSRAGLVSAAVDLVTEHRGSLPIDEVARRLGIGRRQLQRLFRRQVGLSPKTFSRMLRFHRVLELGAHGKNPDWADLAVQGGYCDQSHLLRDFRSFAGRSATAYSKTEVATFGAIRDKPLAGSGSTAEAVLE